MRSAIALIPLLALAACGGGGDNATPVTSESPIAAIAPPAGARWVDTVTKTADGYVQGNPDAPIKLVEYGSRTCPTCGRFAMEAMEPLREKYISTGRVSYEFRDFLVHGAPDFALALLNQCAPTEAFFGMLDQMFAGQAEIGQRLTDLDRNSPQIVQQLQQLPPPQAAAGFADAMGLIDFVKQRGIPEARARQCLSDQKLIEDIARVNAAATSEHGVTGTPSFFINGQKIEAATWAQVEPALRAAGAR